MKASARKTREEVLVAKLVPVMLVVKVLPVGVTVARILEV